jgi:hypothetical protein
MGGRDRPSERIDGAARELVPQRAKTEASVCNHVAGLHDVGVVSQAVEQLRAVGLPVDRLQL